uniref:Uncharacterized protein n=1 Tax=Anolis carolinensis TaxID=28377 RepID=A0A803SSU5_ANOCA
MGGVESPRDSDPWISSGLGLGKRATADPSVINCLHNLSRRIAIVLQHEERRCQYLTREAKLILAIQDEVSAMLSFARQAAVVWAMPSDPWN